MDRQTRLTAEMGKRLKSKRPREVYDVDMVAHLWANQSQTTARNGGSNNFYFLGDSIYSYGSHFIIARHVKNKRGKKAVLFNTSSFSSTTRGHQNVVRGAIATGTVIFHVPYLTHDVGSSIISNLTDYNQRILALGSLIEKARANKGSYIAQLDQLVTEANAYSKFYGQRRKFTANIEAERKKAAELDKANEKRRKARELIVQRENEVRYVKCRERLAEWMSGAEVPKYDFDSLVYSPLEADSEIKLRVVGDMIETSRGAECPVKHALRILPLIRSGRGFKRNGHSIHLGHFHVDSIDTEGNLVAGCHSIKRAEIERIADILQQGVPTIDGNVVLVEDAYDAPAE